MSPACVHTRHKTIGRDNIHMQGNSVPTRQPSAKSHILLHSPQNPRTQQTDPHPFNILHQTSSPTGPLSLAAAKKAEGSVAAWPAHSCPSPTPPQQC